MSIFHKKTPPERSLTDRLTGLKNRDYFHQTYGELGPVKNKDMKVMGVFDIDHFKAANEIIDGDKAIIDIINIYDELLGSEGEILRWGGDEFVIILRSTPEDSIKLLQHFVERVEEETQVTVSVGLVKIRHEDTFKTNYYRAVQKCYLVKEMGGNDVKL